MSLLPLADCARLLGIHPKTLRQWLKQDPLDLFVHPRDARIKCLTAQQVEQLAFAHGRSLPSQTGGLPTSPDVPSEIPASEEVSTSAPTVSQKLSLLETRIAQLSEQVAHLTLTLLKAQERTVERRLSDLETVVQGLAGTPHLSLSSPLGLEQQTEARLEVLHPPTRQPIEAEQRARSRLPALIEYSTQGHYVVISSQEGKMSLSPASPEWFEWLATISSFRFVGQSGRFTAYRESNHGKPTRGWAAHRVIHGRHYKHYLGVTDRLSIDLLEQMAARLQAYLITA